MWNQGCNAKVTSQSRLVSIVCRVRHPQNPSRRGKSQPELLQAPFPYGLKLVNDSKLVAISSSFFMKWSWRLIHTFPQCDCACSIVLYVNHLILFLRSQIYFCCQILFWSRKYSKQRSFKQVRKIDCLLPIKAQKTVFFELQIKVTSTLTLT